MEYVEHLPVSRQEAEHLLRSETPEVVGATLLRLALHDADWRFVQACCVERADHPNVWVRRNCATALGHLARLHGHLDLAVVNNVLSRLALDPEVLSWVEAARDDIEIFILRRQRASRFRGDAL